MNVGRGRDRFVSTPASNVDLPRRTELVAWFASPLRLGALALRALHRRNVIRAATTATAAIHPPTPAHTPTVDPALLLLLAPGLLWMFEPPLPLPLPAPCPCTGVSVAVSDEERDTVTETEGETDAVAEADDEPVTVIVLDKLFEGVFVGDWDIDSVEVSELVKEILSLAVLLAVGVLDADVDVESVADGLAGSVVEALAVADKVKLSDEVMDPEPLTLTEAESEPELDVEAEVESLTEPVTDISTDILSLPVGLMRPCAEDDEDEDEDEDDEGDAVEEEDEEGEGVLVALPDDDGDAVEELLALTDSSRRRRAPMESAGTRRSDSCEPPASASASRPLTSVIE